MKPLVSILIPAYNAEEWIADTIRSALEQTWLNKEIIIVDDGSTDRTLSIARKFASNKLAVHTQVNQGAPHARNRAFSLCQGAYIQWLDADDLLSPHKIERQMEALARDGNSRTALSSGWGCFRYRPRRTVFEPTLLWCDLSPVEWLLRKMEHNLHMQTATWLASRELTETAGPWDVRLRRDQDGEFFCRVLLASAGTRFVPDAFVYYRSTGWKSIRFIGNSNEKKDSLLLSIKLHMQYLQSLENSERVRKTCLTYMQEWFYVFYPTRPDIVAELQGIAAQLQGRLEEPRLRWKYAWIRPVLGYQAAAQLQIWLPQYREALARFWDQACSYWDQICSIWNG